VEFYSVASLVRSKLDTGTKYNAYFTYCLRLHYTKDIHPINTDSAVIVNKVSGKVLVEQLPFHYQLPVVLYDESM